MKKWIYFITPPKREGNGIIPGSGHVAQDNGQKILNRAVYDTVCYLPHWYSEKETGAIEKNAKLMASAPDLLEALYSAKAELLTHFEINQAPVLKQELQLTIDKVQKAINKAIGE